MAEEVDVKEDQCSVIGKKLGAIYGELPTTPPRETRYREWMRACMNDPLYQRKCRLAVEEGMWCSLSVLNQVE